jgi:hypothetical protein
MKRAEELLNKVNDIWNCFLEEEEALKKWYRDNSDDAELAISARYATCTEDIDFLCEEAEYMGYIISYDKKNKKFVMSYII